MKAYPLRLVYREFPVQDQADNPVHADALSLPVQIGFVASKRSFKRAVDRNFVKRRMREAYRLHKAPLYAYCGQRAVRLQGMLIFTGRDLPSQNDLHRAWRKLLRRLDAESSSSS